MLFHHNRTAVKIWEMGAAILQQEMLKTLAFVVQHMTMSSKHKLLTSVPVIETFLDYLLLVLPLYCPVSGSRDQLSSCSRSLTRG